MGSSSRAASDSTAAKTRSMPLRSRPLASCTGNARISGAGFDPAAYQRLIPLSGSVIASAKDLPAERSDAANAATSKVGWLSRLARTCCPAIPVAPTTATLIFIAEFFRETQPVRLGLLKKYSGGGDRSRVRFG